jgi:hypothetical protein
VLQHASRHLLPGPACRYPLIALPDTITERDLQLPTYPVALNAGSGHSPSRSSNEIRLLNLINRERQQHVAPPLLWVLAIVTRGLFRALPKRQKAFMICLLTTLLGGTAGVDIAWDAVTWKLAFVGPVKLAAARHVSDGAGQELRVLARVRPINKHERGMSGDNDKRSPSFKN